MWKGKVTHIGPTALGSPFCRARPRASTSRTRPTWFYNVLCEHTSSEQCRTFLARKRTAPWAWKGHSPLEQQL